MKSKICDLLGIEFPLLAFSHCRDVVAEVSKAGGMGVLGAAAFGPDELEIELDWIDENIEGKPYGVDIIAPTNLSPVASASARDQIESVPDKNREFALGVLEQHGVETENIYTYTEKDTQNAITGFLTNDQAGAIIDVAFSHPIGLIANALGVPPQYMIDRAKKENVPTAALVGSKEHAMKQVEAGVDILVVSGYEAGGHCGEVSTLVLVPEICAALKDSNVPVLAAGGIVTGRQMAACMAMGADGAWTGSVWLTTIESETPQTIKEKYIEATSGHTVRSKQRTGKYSRQLRSSWTEAWDAVDAPDPLPMPIQSLVSEPPLHRIAQMADKGHQGARELATYWVGQGVGLMNSIQTSRQVVYDFMEDFLEAYERLNESISD
ncbi:MAG: nitronate monooxygenase [Gammaproteobacteria bacterium]|nr:nitronate monooxygenase [Gammaproteobacteria bacterium]MYF01417.1 nitronate monooxygenase [Gammaproteobacteria bacterium]